VANGARWLDENFPGWVDRIDIDRLRLIDAHKCICGQVFDTPRRRKRGAYAWAYTHLFAQANSWISDLVPEGTKKQRATDVSAALGFSACEGLNMSWEDVEREFKALESEWKKLLRERQNV
jgi:hypothetical protein